MDTKSLVGTWTGTARNSNGFDLDIRLSISGAAEVGSTWARFDIPAIPCSGTFKLVRLAGDTLELKAENLQGPCGQADFESLQMLPDGTLLYTSRGEGWETQGILRPGDAQ
jgi:hypothetical protein